ncbi:MAG: AraC family transcriptional regulator [Rhodovulum sulfidophilum]|uniref:AraC family transcriptional regulator n=1 Tax=Rhodovulum sulfidophilum TaxID=35806 RepID=A0A2W5N9Y5_RHOSU|nr:MAG: AraC family transcriptional regulator [Rhodovulum sulfidophilum]
MTELVPLERLPDWVPGRILLAGDGLGWRHVGLRTYQYEGQETIVPGMRDYMLVSYCRGATPMGRRFDGRWRRAELGPGAASLLTRAQRAHWHWREQIEVTHLYLAPALVNAVASEVLDCHVSEVRLEDVLRAEDPVITATVAAVADEARARALGGPLYVEALARGLIVHLLRRYAAIERAEHDPPAGLSPARRRAIVDYVEANLGEALTLEAMAAELGLGPCAFARAFRRGFGVPPHAYVIARRVERARRMLVETTRPIKAIAAACGFADQAHLTRLFARELGTTPGALRRSVR